MANRFYYPFEHIAWAIDKRVIPFGESSAKWWNRSSYFSLISSICALAKTVLSWIDIIKRKGELPSSDRRQLRKEEFLVTVDFFTNVARLIVSVHYLPDGMLWGTKLSSTSLGLLGMISSLVSLWKMIDEF